jgi:hypothetical protein
MKAPEPGRFEAGVFIPERLDGPKFAYNLEDPEDLHACRLCEFRTIGLGALVRHGQQEHSGGI